MGWLAVCRRRATRRWPVCATPQTGDTLDHALVLYFEAGRSETGEAMLELHLHGSPAVVAAVLAVLARQPGLRPAEPGEFARRAFLAGKLDFAQIEGLADLIDAETDWQRRQAQRQLSGVMAAATRPWREALIESAALVEAAIDFADEVDLAGALHEKLVGLIAPVRGGLAEELAKGHAAERVRDGVQVVIAGPPNAGKSSLLNALVRREAAIVSALAGTTRDPIEVHLDLGGCPVTLVDTAGLREAADAVEQVGILRARARADQADLVLWLAQEGDAAPDFGRPVWRLGAKADLAGDAPGDVLPVSAHTGRNLDVLVERLGDFARGIAQAGASGLLARARHREAFEAAAAALESSLEADLPVEIVAEHLRAARFALDRLIGTVDVEDILGDVFLRFCIGK